MCPPPTGLITVVWGKHSNFVQIGPYALVCRQERRWNQRENGSSPLVPAAKEEMRKSSPGDTSLAGTSLELESHSNLCQWKTVLEEHLEKCGRESYQFGCIKKFSSLNNTLWLAHNSVAWPGCRGSIDWVHSWIPHSQLPVNEWLQLGCWLALLWWQRWWACVSLIVKLDSLGC